MEQYCKCENAHFFCSNDVEEPIYSDWMLTPEKIGSAASSNTDFAF